MHRMRRTGHKERVPGWRVGFEFEGAVTRHQTNRTRDPTLQRPRDTKNGVDEPRNLSSRAALDQ